MPWYDTFDALVKERFPQLEWMGEEPMARHTTFRTGGPARRMAFPRSGEQLVLLLSLAEDCGARPFVMGSGTNLLAPDQGLEIGRAHV